MNFLRSFCLVLGVIYNRGAPIRQSSSEIVRFCVYSSDCKNQSNSEALSFLLAVVMFSLMPKSCFKHLGGSSIIAAVEPSLVLPKEGWVIRTNNAAAPTASIFDLYRYSITVLRLCTSTKYHVLSLSDPLFWCRVLCGPSWCPPRLCAFCEHVSQCSHSF